MLKTLTHIYQEGLLITPSNDEASGANKPQPSEQIKKDIIMSGKSSLHSHHEHDHDHVLHHRHHHHSIFSTKRGRAASLALAATLLLTLAKIIISALTDSVGVLSEAIHSGLDLLSSIVTFFVVQAAVRPADEDHPFGHGKIESISALFEAFLLLVAGGYIVYEGVAKVFTHNHQIHNLYLGVIISVVSIAINLFVYLQNRRVAKSEESIAIETNAFHFLTDVFSSLAVLIGLLGVHFTKLSFWDPASAIIIAIYVFWVGLEQIKKCLNDLSDSALPAKEVKKVEAILTEHQNDYLGYHDLKTRKVGSVRHIDLHLTVCSEQKVHQAHDVCDKIENDIGHQFKQSNVSIHIEPCGNHEATCEQFCRFYSKPRQ